MIIGLSGYARSGKDTAAEALVAAGWRRVAFADKLREFLLVLNPFVRGSIEDNTVAFDRLSYVIDKYGWGGYKETRYSNDIRGLLQRLGTDCGRELISDTIWIDAALGEKLPDCNCSGPWTQTVHEGNPEGHQVGCPRWGLKRSQFDNICITDLRFPNEAKAIKERGGITVRIERPGVGPANDHYSEHALDLFQFDYVLKNDGSIEELHRKIMMLDEEMHYRSS